MKNEQAFPNPHRTDMGGMSLRDYFAAKAMQGWLATYPDNMELGHVTPHVIAKFSYDMADAMLKARGQA